HRVHVTGEEQLHWRRRPNGQMQMPAMLDLDGAPGWIDSFDLCRPLETDQSRERGEGIDQQIRHSLKPGKVPRAAVDRGPAQYLIEHRLGARTFDDRALTRR